jgi:hypothetical protein
MSSFWNAPFGRFPLDYRILSRYEFPQRGLDVACCAVGIKSAMAMALRGIDNSMRQVHRTILIDSNGFNCSLPGTQAPRAATTAGTECQEYNCRVESYCMITDRSRTVVDDISFDLAPQHPSTQANNANHGYSSQPLQERRIFSRGPVLAVFKLQNHNLVVLLT